MKRFFAAAVPHMSVFALDQDSHCSYAFDQEQQAVTDEMCSRIGCSFTVTPAARYGNRLRNARAVTGILFRLCSQKVLKIF